MKKTRTFMLVLATFGLLIGTSSCVVHHHHDNGKHKGWYKKGHPGKGHGHHKHFNSSPTSATMTIEAGR